MKRNVSSSAETADTPETVPIRNICNWCNLRIFLDDDTVKTTKFPTGRRRYYHKNCDALMGMIV